VWRIALNMLMRDRPKYFGILVGLTFSSLLMTQQAAIFVGLMRRTHGFITDTPFPQLWVMDPHAAYVDDVKPLTDNALFKVRGVEGVAWAVPLYRGTLRASLPDGRLQSVTVVGIDDATLIGGPVAMVEGKLSDLRLKDAVILDLSEVKRKLIIDGRLLGIGDEMEINDRRAIVVGTARNSQTFRSQPTIYTTYSRALSYAPTERKQLSFVLAGAVPGESPELVAKRIEQRLGLKALTPNQFKKMTYDYYMRHTGIPINFGTAVVLGLLVGIAISGQMFYQFTIDNLRYFGTMRALGAPRRAITAMILLQAVMVGIIGYGMGVGLAAVTGLALRRTNLTFVLPWELLLTVGVVVLMICCACAVFSVRKVFKQGSEQVFR
jgi:putative ABC transport system permease protein